MAFDLWKLEFGVIGIHLADLLAGRCAEHFDDLHQLVDARVTREYRLAEQQFGEYAAGAPHIWDGWVCGMKSVETMHKYWSQRTAHSPILVV